MHACARLPPCRRRRERAGFHGRHHDVEGDLLDLDLRRRVGKADVESRFSGSGYAAAIVGSTSGVSRLVSDASARLTGNGHIFGTEVLPATYDMATVENGFSTHVTMAMRQGAVTSVVAAARAC